MQVPGTGDSCSLIGDTLLETLGIPAGDIFVTFIPDVSIYLYASTRSSIATQCSKEVSK